MFKKAGNGWKILSLANGQYWVEEPDYGAENLTIYQGKAGEVKIAKSNNLENAFVIYRDIEPDTVKGSFKNEDAGVEIPETEIIRTKLVYMDWDGGIASRPCYSELPGVLAPGCEALTDEFKVTSGAGDYLHFNKTNGEGEWKIYEATMNDQYYAYLLVSLRLLRVLTSQWVLTLVALPQTKLQLQDSTMQRLPLKLL
jgi:hypothetical protein